MPMLFGETSALAVVSWIVHVYETVELFSSSFADIFTFFHATIERLIAENLILPESSYDSVPNEVKTNVAVIFVSLEWRKHVSAIKIVHFQRMI